MNRLLFLDALRGIAALSVALFHYTSVYRSLYGHRFSPAFDFDYGLFGVELFFMISGFVIFFSFDRIKSGSEFLFNRGIRLYPTYWFSMITTFLVVQTFGLPGFETTFTDMLVNLTMFQKLARVPDVDGVYWSLFSEWMFYLMMLGLFMTNNLKRILWVGPVWVLLSLVHKYAFSFGPVGAILNLYHGVFFYAGILFYLLMKQPEKQNVFFAHLLFCIACIVALYLPEGLPHTLVVISFFGIIYLGLKDKMEFLVNKALLFLGGISYALYLIHQFVGYVIIRETQHLFGDSLLVIVPPLVISLTAAWLITTYIEKPAVNRLKTWYKQRSGHALPQEKKVPVSGFAKPETVPTESV
ncbi:acyltransferase family protein [Pontibacter indicus]|uniref:Peptidoglycan/LPS O-acetylase OafA/YrhL, contains acyltransferase and SGNH-hydrolase domains n=1 Tax=Pontibacter indicus TaxID=1317125 RepID=A0A1R3WFD2_9BACT|nr:acyltransferase [Pontibacter indicus]SIT76628.1 Peptidoglycan/LPS O-acetylase OafA/YrhL, contains acyltransferase and SGNH-hydrolase domains [Pontibacter indicus]